MGGTGRKGGTAARRRAGPGRAVSGARRQGRALSGVGAGRRCKGWVLHGRAGQRVRESKRHSLTPPHSPHAQPLTKTGWGQAGPPPVRRPVGPGPTHPLPLPPRPHPRARAPRARRGANRSARTAGPGRQRNASRRGGHTPANTPAPGGAEPPCRRGGCGDGGGCVARRGRAGRCRRAGGSG